MAVSKAMKAPRLITMTASGTDDLTGGTAFVTAVNEGGFQAGAPGVQWKMKELLFSRSLTGSADLTVKLVDQKTGAKFTIAEVLGFTTASARIPANLVNGEYFVDADAELEVTTANLGGSETWNLRMTGQIVGHE